MAQPVPFVDREQELARIDALVQEWGTRRVLCIDAPAGMGKTWLLREAHRRYCTSGHNLSPLVVTDILDFDDPALHIPQNVAYRIAHMLDAKLFDPYLFVLHNWHRSGLSGINSEQIEHANLALSQTFVNCFNSISSQQRVVLFMDTINALEEAGALQYMIETARRLDNTVLLVAGRNAARIGELLQTKLHDDVQIVRLLPLDSTASERYLSHAPQRLPVPLEPRLLRTMIMLAEGRPLLLKLAAAWLASAQSPAWLAEYSPEELQALSDEPLRDLRQRFEHLLIHHAVAPATLPGQLALLMSRLAPVDREMIRALLQISAAEADSLLEEASNLAFVRTMPQQCFALHDDIQRMIDEYIWPAIDPTGEQQLRDSQRIADYLGQMVRSLAQRIDHLRSSAPELPEEQAEAPGRVFMEQSILNQQMWLRKGQQLAHMLCVDINTGLQMFVEMFDEATRSYSLRFRETLFERIMPFLGKLTPEQQHALTSRRLHHLMDRGEYGRVRHIASELLGQDTILPEQRADLLILLGNVEIRMGYFDQSVAHFDRSIRICHLNGLRAELVRALNARGWAYRNQGRHSEAMTDYLDAYQLSLQLQDMEQTAWILTNISFVSTLRGDRQSAFESCQTALKLWEANGNLRGTGAAYSTLGGFYVRFNEPAEAMQAYTRALDIFMHEHDLDWMSLVRCGRSYVFQSQGELDKADDDLSWAMQHGPAHLRTRILYSQGLVCRSRQDLLSARQKLEECRRLSQEVGDHFHDYKSFADLIELAWEFGEYDQWPIFAQQLESLYTLRDSAEAIRLRGSCLRKIADLAICSGDYDSALAFYEEGFPLLAEYEIHERYTIRSQMRQTDERLHARIPRKMLGNLGKALAQFWRRHPVLIVKYPEALLTFHNWEKEGADFEQSVQSNA